MKCQIWHLAMFTHINKPDTFAPARNSYGQSSSVQALRMVIIGAISVNGAAPIIRVEIHRQIDVHTFRYRKIPKISPGAYVRRELCVSKSIALACSGKETHHFCFVLLSRANSKYKPPGRLIFGGAIWRRDFCVTVLGGLYLEGLIHGGAYFRNFTVAFPVGTKSIRYCVNTSALDWGRKWNFSCTEPKAKEQTAWAKSIQFSFVSPHYIFGDLGAVIRVGRNRHDESTPFLPTRLTALWVNEDARVTDWSGKCAVWRFTRVSNGADWSKLGISDL